ncbi:hypothetical protein MasN3_46140 [Massilia varians]|uniref:Uncharacterized protein n=1 Tax=Massilia varians TaxID=457921 RepID=A0ABM8CCU6_9BURK|nr:hypothetical protein [Massilia varians]BDT61120.1 hypothetical protein MasN3_46140 [Massilia varians]
MSMRDGIFTTVAVTLSGVALAGLLGTDAYSQAAGAEARGLKALSMQVETRLALDCKGCPEGESSRWAAAAQGAGQ